MSYLREPLRLTISLDTEGRQSNDKQGKRERYSKCCHVAKFSFCCRGVVVVVLLPLTVVAYVRSDISCQR